MSSSVAWAHACHSIGGQAGSTRAAGIWASLWCLLGWGMVGWLFFLILIFKG